MGFNLIFAMELIVLFPIATIVGFWVDFLGHRRVSRSYFYKLIYIIIAGSGVWGLGFGVWGLGFGGWGLGFG
jgi:hypothetical protein